MDYKTTADLPVGFPAAVVFALLRKGRLLKGHHIRSVVLCQIAIGKATAVSVGGKCRIILF